MDRASARADAEDSGVLTKDSASGAELQLGPRPLEVFDKWYFAASDRAAARRRTGAVEYLLES